jgi:hypothetical protein
MVVWASYSRLDSPSPRWMTTCHTPVLTSGSMDLRFTRFGRYVPVETTVNAPANTMTTASIEGFLVNSGFAAQSLDAVRPDLPRWLRHLQERGVTDIPASPWTSGPHALAANLISQQALQASPRKDPIAKATAHHLRDVTETRPYKG